MAFLMIFGAAVNLAYADSTLEAVKIRGNLRCGVGEHLPGFSTQGANGQWQGMDIDFCRAVAAAVLLDSRKVTFIPLSTEERFEALRLKKIDLLARNTTWTFERQVEEEVDFIGALYYDGQGFLVPPDLMVNKSLVNSLKQIVSPVSICVLDHTTSQTNLDAYLLSHKLPHMVLKFQTISEGVQAYRQGICQVYTGDLSALASTRKQSKDLQGHRLLPEVISKEPLSPLVRKEDGQWRDIVQWVLFTLINAEELGISSQQVDQWKMGSPKKLGLDPTWSVRMIQEVGNYAELFERNLGRGGLGLDRGLNLLWKEGGILYAPPMR